MGGIHEVHFILPDEKVHKAFMQAAEKCIASEKASRVEAPVINPGL